MLNRHNFIKFLKAMPVDFVFNFSIKYVLMFPKQQYYWNNG